MRGGSMGLRLMGPIVPHVFGAALPETFLSRVTFWVSGGSMGGVRGILHTVDAKVDGTSHQGHGIVCRHRLNDDVVWLQTLAGVLGVPHTIAFGYALQLERITGKVGRVERPLCQRSCQHGWNWSEGWRPLGVVSIKWPRSRDEVWKANTPHTHLAQEKSDQNWMVVKDAQCGVACFGAYLLSLNIIAMYVAPNDVHQNQIQFTLERGIPTYLDVLGMKRLPSDIDPDATWELPMEACISPYSDLNWSVYQVWGISMMHEMPHPESQVFENLDIISS
ncbi:hypothetical protein GIB67_020848 [Kingdonia uniflora]|uniref:Methyltransferase n=1 Tax=Kingdonia uniflora TaxID=39325 RepID=A0A7J7M7B2_9MAGN|nr:hypothetical protein GIB67_020848 [Kingdonia uniflora]